MPEHSIDRREFVRRSLGSLGAVAAAAALPRPASAAETRPPKEANSPFSGEQLEQIAFPMGGMGAGMMCLEGAGSLTHVSIRNRPALQNQPGLFSAIAIRGPKRFARVIEGPVPRWKLYERRHACNGAAPMGTGFPRYEKASFRAQFPFARIDLEDSSMPLAARITGWSPFEPGDADNSSLPVAALEYAFIHNGDEELEAVFSFNANNFLPAADGAPDSAERRTRATPGGFIFHGGASPSQLQEEAWLAAAVDDPAAKVNLAWFRGDGFDPQTMAWRDIEQGAAFDRPLPSEGPAPTGASIFVPFRILPGESKTIRVRLSWYSPRTRLREPATQDTGGGTPAECYRPWYGTRFASIEEVDAYWRARYFDLRRQSERFSTSFFDSTLPPEAVEAAAANLAVLKSPTLLRQADGRLWGWEGCDEDRAQGPGSFTPVWNYAQSIAHLFPALEQALRETEFTVGQDDRGHQNSRMALPIRPAAHDGPASADGQLGGILKAHREWRIGGDTRWLRGLWPRIRSSLDYCIRTWDPRHRGWLEEPHEGPHGDEVWGPEPKGTVLYLGALQSAVAMAGALGEPVAPYAELLSSGRALANEHLFNGEYFYQNIASGDPKSAATRPNRFDPVSSEEAALMDREGPKYQTGTGCLSDALLGAWLALVCGVGQVIDAEKVRSHLLAVSRHNFKPDLSGYANPQRPTYANGHEGGLLLCTWPRGNMPSLPFAHSCEVWTGVEYQAASHMILVGLVAEGLEIVRACRARYDGTARNPFDEYEWGHWHARAMSSYGLIEALSGARYDAVDKVLHIEPAVRGDFRSFISTASGYGTVGVVDGKPFLNVVSGRIEVKEFRFAAAPNPVQ